MIVKHNSLSILLFHIFYLNVSALAQSTDEVKQIAASLDQFGLKFLAKTSEEVGDSINLALSPYTIWNLMTVLNEGALENTALELQNTLGIPSKMDKEAFRNTYQALRNYLIKEDEADVILDTTNSIFTTADLQLKPTFLQLARSIYNVNLIPINFKNTADAVNIINNRINNASRGRIINFVKEGDIRNAKAFMASVLFFKGTWATEFNKTATSRENFYDDKGNQIGQVDMMYNAGPFPYTLLFDEKAIALELPYKNNSMSMIVILPKTDISLQSILNVLAESTFSTIVDDLDRSIEDFGDEPVNVYLPKFKIISDLNINSVLSQMGIKDIFSENDANLLGMFNYKLYISTIIQRAEINVDEEGTVASSASGATLQYRSLTPKFIANRPFAYFIYNKETRAIVFAGKISNPELL